jgi:hypothetical protein
MRKSFNWENNRNRLSNKAFEALKDSCTTPKDRVQ